MARDEGILRARSLLGEHGGVETAPYAADSPLHHVAHDKYGAPFATNPDGTEKSDLLVSFSDEDSLTLGAWMYTEPASPVLGMGIDLVMVTDFVGTRGAYYRDVLLTPDERALAQTLYPETPEVGYALAFAAKEAGFKACSAPLRRWRKSGGQRLAYDVRDFVLTSAREVEGGGRTDRAVTACACLGISRFELTHALADGLLLVVVRALA